MRVTATEKAEGRGTRERILNAAERLFAEHGYAAASLRAVSAEAAVNLNSINYHFGSKAGLLRAVVRHVVGPVNAEQLRRLDGLEAGGKDPSVEQLLDALLSPFFELTDPTGRKGGGAASRFAGRVLGDPGEEFRDVVADEVAEVRERYLEAFARALPHLSEGELWWRFRSVTGVMVAHGAGTFPYMGRPVAPNEGGRDDRNRAVAFLSAAMRAPAAD